MFHINSLATYRIDELTCVHYGVFIKLTRCKNPRIVCCGEPHLQPSREVASDELDAALFECFERSENGTHHVPEIPEGGSSRA